MSGSLAETELQDRISSPNLHPSLAELLNRGMIALDENAPALIHPVSLRDQGLSMREVCQVAIRNIFDTGRDQGHILCDGFQRGPGAAVRQLRPNGPLEELCRGPWPLLLRLAGDSLLSHLLVNGTVFVPLPNSCYLQLCGLRLDSTVWAMRGRPAGGRPAQHDGHRWVSCSPSG